MQRPDIAIVSSLYRSEEHYNRFVPSVVATLRELAAKGVSCELVFVINDATDADREAVAKAQSELSDVAGAQVKSLEVPREGLYASWNRGIRATTAGVVGFWNADDVRSAGAMVEGLRRIESGADLVFFEWLAESGTSAPRRIQLPPFDPFIYSRFMLFGPFFLFRRELFGSVGPFDEQLRVVGDMDWSIRAIQTTDRIEKAEASGGVFRDAGGGLSTSNRKRLLREQKWVRLRFHQYDFLPLWASTTSEGFRLEAAQDSAVANPQTKDGWFPLPDSQRSDIIPSEQAIRFFLKRGRLRYRLWTRLLWALFPRHDLRELRKRLNSGR